MRTYTPNDLLGSLTARRWWILVPFAIGLASAPLLARFAPERYRSETLILVVPQRVPDSYVKATVTEKIEDRLPSISEQILSRSRLERIITDMNLYVELRAKRVMEDVVAAMRKDVAVTLAANKDADSFRVAYVNGNPGTARRVTERLASLYIEQNLKDRENQANSTSQFLETQLQDAKQRLVDHEKKLEAYRKQHSGELPTQLQGNLQSIQNASLQLQALNESKNRAVERRMLIERQIADTEAAPPTDTPYTQLAPLQAPTTTRQALDIARARLSALRDRFTDEHPEVVSLQRQVGELQARLESESPLGENEVAPAKALSPAEASQRKRVLDLKGELLVVDKQLESTRDEEAQLKNAIATLQIKVDALPSRESELVELTRDYTTLQASYGGLLVKREDSMMAANLERRQIGEQFRILDPASLPERPFNLLERMAITLAGAGAGLLLGFVMAVFQEFRDSSFRNEDEVMAALSLPVLALIPVMSSERERHQIVWRRRWADIAGTALLIMSAAVVLIWRLRA